MHPTRVQTANRAVSPEPRRERQQLAPGASYSVQFDDDALTVYRGMPYLDATMFPSYDKVQPTEIYARGRELHEDHIIDRATIEEPARPSEGVRYVLINGVLVVKEKRLQDGVLPGKAIRAEIH